MKFSTAMAVFLAAAAITAVSVPVDAAKDDDGIHPDLRKLKRSSSGHIIYSKDVATASQRKQLKGDTLLKLYIMTGDGKGQAAFIEPEGLVFAAHPSFSLDGKSLIFTSNYQNEKSGYYADAFEVRLSDGKYRRLTGDTGRVSQLGDNRNAEGNRRQ